MEYPYNYTFIIPHHNIPNLLNRCINSIPQRDDVQIIVVDDNSSIDQRPSNLRDDVKCIFLDKDHSCGAGRARNVGIEASEGKWLLFADADDFFGNNLLEILDKCCNSNSDIIYFGFKRCDSDDISVEIPSSNFNDLLLHCASENDFRYFRTCYSSPWGKMFSSDFIRTNEIFYQETKANNDTFFVVSAGLKAKDISCVNHVIYWYTIRKGSISQQQSPESFVKVKDRVYVHWSVQNILENSGIRTKLYLPSTVCGSLFKRSFIGYCKMLKLLPQYGINPLRVSLGLIKVFVYKYIKKNTSMYQLYCFNNCKISKSATIVNE